jgi:hypothetical protein
MFFQIYVYWISNNYIILVLNKLCHIGWGEPDEVMQLWCKSMGMLWKEIKQNRLRKEVAYLSSCLILSGQNTDFTIKTKTYIAVKF